MSVKVERGPTFDGLYGTGPVTSCAIVSGKMRGEDVEYKVVIASLSEQLVGILDMDDGHVIQLSREIWEAVRSAVDAEFELCDQLNAKQKAKR